jgi:hypothetical protein
MRIGAVRVWQCRPGRCGCGTRPVPGAGKPQPPGTCAEARISVGIDGEFRGHLRIADAGRPGTRAPDLSKSCGKVGCHVARLRTGWYGAQSAVVIVRCFLSPEAGDDRVGAAKAGEGEINALQKALRQNRPAIFAPDCRSARLQPRLHSRACGEAYPVDSGLSRCSMLSDWIGAVARADADGEGAVARGIPKVVSR